MSHPSDSHGLPSHNITSETIGLNSSKSILEQVDDYLNDDAPHNDHRNDSTILTEHDHSHWASENLQLDLDDLSHSLLKNDNSLRSGEHFQLDLEMLDGHQHEHQRHEHGDQNHEQLHREYSGKRHEELQQQQQQQQQQQHQQHVRPDMLFSPMVSPMVAPQYSAQNTPFMNPGLPTSATSNTPYHSANNRKSSFSPLSSPALTAIDQAQSSNFTLSETNASSKKNSSSTRTKKTPHSTPALVATTSSKVAKQSPQINSRRNISSKFKGSNGNWDDMFKLPDSSMPPPPGRHSQSHGNTTEEATPKSTSSASSTHSTYNQDSGEPRVTPATLMNYPKIILPSNNNRDATPTDPANMRNINVIRATESPVLRPKMSSHQSHNSRQNSINSASRQTPELNPRRRSSKTSLNEVVVSEGDEVVKKEVHKVAEQGRRNRLNNALTELHALIPQDLKETVLIPSKATTVELACQYIKILTGQQDEAES